MAQLKRKKLVIYPFAHLSSELADPKSAMELISYMAEKRQPRSLRSGRRPFGWNKKLSIAIKGHPLAEQSRSYGKGEVMRKEIKKGEACRGEHLDSEEERLVGPAGHGPQDHRGEARPLQLPGGLAGDGLLAPERLIIYKELVRFIREKDEEYGYQEIARPRSQTLRSGTSAAT